MVEIGESRVLRRENLGGGDDGASLKLQQEEE